MLTKAQYEKIGKIETRVVEEIGEVLQAMGKVDRFGLHSVNPELPKSKQIKNHKHLRCEIDQLVKVLMEYSGTITNRALQENIDKGEYD